MNTKKIYDAVVFDMDGVIFDSERAVMKCWMELARKYGIENIEEPPAPLEPVKTNSILYAVMEDGSEKEIPYTPAEGC